MSLPPLPTGYSDTRDELQRVAIHVLARARFEGSGRIGLRATASGFGTPAFGADHEVLRVSGTTLVRETAGAVTATTTIDLRAAGLADAAAFAGVDLADPFAAGDDTPTVGDTEAPLAVDAEGAGVVAEWFRFAWAVLDTAVSELAPTAMPAVVQLWPEHFDAATDVAVAPGRRVNLGASPGDGFHAQPYLYVGPWDPDRPGDPDYWHAPFGAYLTYEELRAAADPAALATTFLTRGLALCGAGSADLMAPVPG